MGLIPSVSTCTSSKSATDFDIRMSIMLLDLLENLVVHVADRDIADKERNERAEIAEGSRKLLQIVVIPAEPHVTIFLDIRAFCSVSAIIPRHYRGMSGYILKNRSQGVINLKTIGCSRALLC